MKAQPLPSVRRIRAVQRRLRREQGPFQPKPRLRPLDEVVATVLSQHTSDRNSERAFASLVGRFGSWEEVLDAPTEEVASAIRSGGIANRKAARIQRILAEIERREGRVDLDRLETLGDGEVEGYLTSLPGVGPKTAACVLLFSMGRSAFPIDTHVHRVTTRLGWIPAGASAERAHQLLGRLVPADIRYDLHVGLITHGRTVCKAQRPRCSTCVLRDLCAFGAALGPGSVTCPTSSPALRPRGGAESGIALTGRAIGTTVALLSTPGGRVPVQPAGAPKGQRSPEPLRHR